MAGVLLAAEVLQVAAALVEVAGLGQQVEASQLLHIHLYRQNHLQASRFPAVKHHRLHQE